MLERPKPSVFASSQVQNLREILKDADVPQATADQVVQQQNEPQGWIGYVYKVETVSEGTYVTVAGVNAYGDNPNPTADDAGFQLLPFPPNDPKYLAELLRALNYPHLRVFCNTGFKGLITYLKIFTDYDQLPVPRFQPPFDVREIKNTA